MFLTPPPKHTAMVVKDMKIEKMFLEGGAVVQNSEPDPFEVSTAESLLQYCTDNK
jgi:peroxiredoxin